MFVSALIQNVSKEFSLVHQMVLMDRTRAYWIVTVSKQICADVSCNAAHLRQRHHSAQLRQCLLRMHRRRSHARTCSDD
eukprot:760139-Amphidinium_carterae.1